MIDGAMLVSTEMSHGIVHFLIMSKHMYPKVDRRKICWGNHSKRKSSHRPKCTVLSIFKKMAMLIWNTPMITANFILKELK